MNVVKGKVLLIGPGLGLNHHDRSEVNKLVMSLAIRDRPECASLTNEALMAYFARS